MTIWTGKQVAEYIGKEAPIKINANGVDIGVSEVWRIPDEAKAIIHGKQREVIPEKELVNPDKDFYILNKGVYEIRTANKIKVPINATGFTFPRSTFNRLGIIKSQTAVWDSGYNGFGTQTFYIPIKEVKIHKDEAWIQLVFISNKAVPKGLYDGHWQNEKPKN